MNNWPEKVAVLAALMWLLAFVKNIEGRRDIPGAALWATIVFLPITLLFVAGIALFIGAVWLASRALA